MNPLIAPLTPEHLKVSDIDAIYRRHGSGDNFRRWAISAIDHLDTTQMWRPIWLLRRSLADAPPLTDEDLGRLIEKADGFDHWLARLNFCQLMAEVTLPVSLRADALPILVALADDRRVIIRAWAISGLFPHRGDPAMGPPIRRLIDRSKKETSKAMQARLRRLQETKLSKTPTRSVPSSS